MNTTSIRRGRRWKIVLLVLIALALLTAGAASYVLSLPAFGDRMEGDRLTRARANPHYHDGRFANPLPPASYRFDDAWAIFKGQFFGNEVRVPPSPVPVVTVDAAALKNPPASTGLRAFWIGHASVYVEIDGLRVLIDPIFSDYASPFAMGPRRFFKPPIALADLPPIDAVLISHDHYDHLDMPSIQQLAARGTAFFVPLGIGAHLKRWGVPEALVHDMEWWQEHELKGVRLVSTPARHYSGRALADRNATLWTSWSVLGPQHRFFFSGDSGYSDHFKTIGDKFGPFDLSFIKIGAYGPGAPWLDIHMSAEDAVRAHGDVRAKRLFPVHWGTFNLAFHDWDEPIKHTLAAARAVHAEVLTPRPGEMVDADQPFASKAWWEAVR